MRLKVVAFVLVLAALVSACGTGRTRVYTDKDTGFSVVVDCTHNSLTGAVEECSVVELP